MANKTLNDRFNLSDKQIMFCNEYMIDSNGTQAAIRSGYSEKTANEQASQLLAKLNIQNFLFYLKEKKAKKYEITAEEITSELKKIAFSNISKIHKTWTDREDFETLKKENPDILAAIQSINTRTSKRMFGDELIEVEQVKVSFYSKDKALDMLGKRIGYFEQDNAQKNNMNIVIKYKDFNKED